MMHKTYRNRRCWCYHQQHNMLNLTLVYTQTIQTEFSFQNEPIKKADCSTYGLEHCFALFDIGINGNYGSLFFGIYKF